MSERSSAEELTRLWSGFLGEGSEEELTGFLLDHSNLPGPRANLTLVWKTSSLVAESWSAHRGQLKTCLEGWRDSGDEYLLLTLHTALGYIIAEHPEEDEWALRILYEGNFSPLWRAREGVTLGLGAALGKRPELVLGVLREWCSEDSPLLIRNALMVLADPERLEGKPALVEELEAYISRAMNLVRDATPEDRRDPGFKILKKTLGFVISVAAVEDEAFLGRMEEWIGAGVKAWRPILRSNLKKNRMRRRFGPRIDELLAMTG